MKHPLISLEQKRLRRYSILAACMLTVFIGSSLVWSIFSNRVHILEIAKSEARSNFNKDYAIRSWASKHGGVYVPMNERTPANPYLSHLPNRTILHPNGDTLTLMNPAYIIRQMFDEFPKEYGIVGRITSLKPLNINNSPDAWESNALRSFEAGVKEVFEVATMNGREYLRLMQPMVTQKECLKCHASQGYREGDIRGGVGVAVPMEPLWGMAKSEQFNMILGHLLFLLIGYSGIGFFYVQISRQYKERLLLENDTRAKDERLRLALQSVADGVWDWEIQTGKTVFNERWAQLLGYTLAEISPTSIETWEQLIHPDDRARSYDLLQKHFRGEIETYECEARMKHKDGNWVWILDRGKVVEWGEDKKPVRMTGTHVDITERKRNEEIIQRNIERHETILETLSEGVALNEIVFDENGEMIDYRILEVNRSFYQTADYVSGVTVVGNLATNVYGMDLETIRTFWQQHKHVTSTVTTEFVSPIKKSIYSISTSPFKNNRFVTTFRDISASKRDEQIIRASEEKLKKAQRYARIGSWTWEIKTNHLEWSDEMHRIFGLDKGTFTGSLSDIIAQAIHPDDRSKVERANLSVINDHRPIPTEYRIIWPDGSVHTVWGEAGEMIFDEHGGLISLSGTVQDITERKRTEEKLQQLSQAVEQSPVSVVITDTAGNIEYVNPKFEEVTGYRLDEARGKNPRILQSGLTAPEHYRSLWETILHGKEWQGEFSNRKKSGELYWESAKISPILNSDGRTTHYLAIKEDITERKKTEEQIRAKDSEFRKLSANVPDLIYQFTRRPDGSYCVPIASEGIRNIFGCAPEDVVDDFSPIARVIHPDDAEMVTRDIEYSAEHLTYFVCEFRVLIPGKPVQWIYSRSTPERLPDGSVTWYGFNTNITERKHAEVVLQKSEELFSKAFKTITESLAITSLDEGRYIEVNDAFLKKSGFSRDEVIGHTSNDLNFWVHQSERQTYVELLMQQGFTNNMKVQYRMKNGETRDFLVSSDILILDGRKCILSFINDITKQQRNESLLKASELKFRTLADFTYDWEFWKNEQDQIEYMSPTCERITGYTQEEFISDPQLIEYIIHPDDKAMMSEHLSNAHTAEMRGHVGEMEFKILHKNGAVIHIHHVCRPIYDEQNRYLGRRVSNRDVTERKIAEQALQQAQKLESIGTLAGGIAHDFNNLMNAVLGQSSLALNKLPKENPAVNHILKAIKASERVADLTKQLLAYSGKGKFIIDEIDLNNLVKENIQFLEVSIPKSSQLKFVFGNPPPYIKGDMSQIQQIIMNLIINAGEAIGTEPGSINLRTSIIEIGQSTMEYSRYTNLPLEKGSYALLQVQDTGGGMSRETLSRIFDPFFSTKFTGRGLGLAAVLGIIKGHKGGLRIESEIGKGTLFEILFPLAVRTKMTEVEKGSPEVAEGKGAAILVIDDDPMVIELLEDVLTDAHFSIVKALDPREGIEIYRQDHQTIALIILDYSMPTMDGKKAFEELTAIDQNAKIILCSGYSEDETLSSFGKDRPLAFFQKPYQTESLLKKILEILALSQ